ncbi:thioredoxin family protein [Candidatus Micrarchaeota archaeon]|nr:thioredoxin family protein [Candidatus Micrarchaeota archaeon]
MTITEITQDPKKIVPNTQLAVVVFYASWCGDCKRSLRYEKKLSEEFLGKVTFYRMDAEKYESIADQYGVENYPTYILLKNGKVTGNSLVEPSLELQVKNWLITNLR